jgi:glucokinase
MLAVGVDIGGTESAVCLGEVSEEQVDILYKCKPLKTKTHSVQEMLDFIVKDILLCKRLKPNEKYRELESVAADP